MNDTDKELPDGVVRDPARPDEEQLPPAEIWDGDETRVPAPDDEAAPTVQGDRGISPVGGRFGASKGQKMAAMGALLVVAAIAAFAVTQGDGEAKSKRPNEERSSPARAVVEYEGPATPPPPPPTLGGDAEAAILAGEAPPAGRPNRLGQEEEKDPRIVKLEASRRAEILAFSTGPVQSAMRNVTGAMQGGGGAGQDGSPVGVVSALLGGVNERSELDGLRGASSISHSRARMLPNRNFLITAGTQIPCILQTAMDTATPGFVSCLVSRDVYSDNGNVVLMEKGTRVLGEYRGGLKRGQNRMFVVWNRAVTPKGVAVDLASPAADALGRAGMSGDIETFFWQRFGGAILLSVVDDAVTVAARSNEDARQTVRQPSDAASIALENSVNIPPVLRKAQGEQVSIFAANDFDFSSVYGLALR